MLAQPPSRPTADRLNEAAGALPRELTLERLLESLRTLMHVDAAAFLPVGRDRRRVEPLAGWFASPDLRDAVEGSQGLARMVAERDRALLLPRVEALEAAPDLLASIMDALGEAHATRVWSVYRTASVIACPVKNAAGLALGVLVVASLDPAQPLRAEQLRIVDVLADLAALALERSELLEAEGRRAQEERWLKRAAEEISGSLELDEVYRRVVDHAARVTGASRAVLTRVDGRGGALRTAGSVDLGDGLVPQRLQLDRATLADVARRRTPSRTDDGLLLHAPIELGPRMFGVLTVAHDEAGRLGEEELELLVKLARSSAAAIANALDFQRERRIARALTLGFVPESLPEVTGFDSGLLYAPAAGEPTGGDVYGAWGLPGGEVAVMVGDVAGKGVETAALSAMVRFFVEARSWDSAEPSAVLAQANSMLMNRLPADTFVTAFLGVLVPDGLRYCNAGHLPPLLVRDGDARQLAGNALPLGIDDEPGYQDAELPLEPGDLVFAYTDGLAEARRGSDVYGLRRLETLVRGRAGSLAPQELVRSVHEEVAAWGGGLADDCVALALRRRTA
ncbi:MAG TPA: SpoIIE family protein phosphatase [Thermoleophilaceae bacterium]|jgi:serine phosphatase RsbU (regulator of sigma subunit)